MRIVLAIISFILAVPFLAYSGLIAFTLAQEVQWGDLADLSGEIGVALAIFGVSFVIGLALAVAGILVLSTKRRRQQ